MEWPESGHCMKVNIDDDWKMVNIDDDWKTRKVAMRKHCVAVEKWKAKMTTRRLGCQEETNNED